MSYESEMISEEDAARERASSGLEMLDELKEDDPYLRALEWANTRGASSGSQEMRKLLLSLFNERAFPHSAGAALRRMNTCGARLVFEALAHFRYCGETAELRLVGEKIKASGMVDAWILANINRSRNQ